MISATGLTEESTGDVAVVAMQRNAKPRLTCICRKNDVDNDEVEGIIAMTIPLDMIHVENINKNIVYVAIMN